MERRKGRRSYFSQSVRLIAPLCHNRQTSARQRPTNQPANGLAYFLRLMEGGVVKKMAFKIDSSAAAESWYRKTIPFFSPGRGEERRKKEEKEGTKGWPSDLCISPSKATCAAFAGLGSWPLFYDCNAQARRTKELLEIAVSFTTTRTTKERRVDSQKTMIESGRWRQQQQCLVLHTQSQLQSCLWHKSRIHVCGLAYEKVVINLTSLS